MQIRGHNAIVTGGASGLGRAVVDALIARGAQVASLDLHESHGATWSGQVDVTDQDAVDAAVAEAAARLGSIHFVVNCAGLGITDPVLGADGVPAGNDIFEQLVGINLKGTWNVLRSAVARMEGNAPDGGGERGVVINTASVAAHEAPSGMAAYAASKAGVAGMTVPLASDLGRYGIRVVSIAPGLFETPLLANLPDGVRDVLERNMIFPRRAGDPARFADLVLHVIENDYINATTIFIHAGARAPLPQ